MISVQVEFLNDQFRQLRVEGHQIRDTQLPLVCNSVSILTQTFEESVLRLVDQKAFLVENETGKSRLVRNSKELNTEQMNILEPLVKSYLIGMKMIRESFPGEVSLSLKTTDGTDIKEKGASHGT